jgi:hypothetical protein
MDGGPVRQYNADPCTAGYVKTLAIEPRSASLIIGGYGAISFHDLESGAYPFLCVNLTSPSDEKPHHEYLRTSADHKCIDCPSRISDAGSILILIINVSRR